MDESGVEVHVLSVTTPALHNLEPEEIVILARRTNDLVGGHDSELSHTFPGFRHVTDRRPQGCCA
jgi:hypothetical protein